MVTRREGTRDLIYEEIERVAKEAREYPAPAAAAVLRDLAVAYRAVYGGAQPGGSVIDGR